MAIYNNKYEKVAEQVKEIIKFDDQKKAFESAAILKEYIKREGYEKTDPELFSAYNKLIIQLKWVALPMLKREEIEKMFTEDLVETFNMEYFDLWDKFKTVLIAVIMLHEERDRFKEKIRSLINKNKAVLTSGRLEGDAFPTVENWVKSYTAAVGLGPVESVKMQNYILNSANVKKLKSEEKERVKILFQFYERLKLSSMTAAGIEETIPVGTADFKGVIKNGRLERDSSLPPEAQKILDAVLGIKKEEEALPIPPPKRNPIAEAEAEANAKELARLKELLENYPAKSLERKAIEGEIRKLEIRSRK